MKLAIAFLALLLLCAGTAQAECISGTVLDVSDDASLTVLCDRAQEPMRITLYGLSFQRGAMPHVLHFLRTSLTGRQVNCFFRPENVHCGSCSSYVALEHDGSVQKLLIREGLARVAGGKCRLFICQEMLKTEYEVLLGKAEGMYSAGMN